MSPGKIPAKLWPAGNWRTGNRWLLSKMVAAGALLLVLVWQGCGFRLMSVQSDSMVPFFHRGDIIITRAVAVYDAKVGMVVSYIDPRYPQIVTTHRIVALDPIQGTVTTKGDANAAPDRPAAGQQILGKVAVVAPGLGRLANMLHNWWVLTTVLYVPMSFLVGRESVRLGRYYLRPTYRLPGRSRDSSGYIHRPTVP